MHVAITAVNFDKSPEGICTGLLIRALLDFGIRITLITSGKAKLGFTHPNFKCVVIKHTPREPDFFLRGLAWVKGDFYHRFYLWGKRASEIAFKENDIPDVIYGRAWPFSSLEPAYELSRHYRIPLIIHLSDPIPPPNEKLQTRFLKRLDCIMKQASAITFTNQETVKYQRKFVDYGDLIVDILPHVGPKKSYLDQANNEENYYHIGAIGNRESVLPILFQGMKLHREEYPQARLNFVNPRRKQIDPHLIHEQAGRFVDLHPFLPDINDAIAPASVLVSLEPKVDQPIWTLTKTVHYLFTNRKIFAVTCAGSPTQRMLDAFPETCGVVTEYTAESIADGLSELRALKPSPQDFEKRLEAMKEFTSERVAGKFYDLCKKVFT
ncbi:MAG: hypothetical protein LGR52_13965 [Candidatus Thiosymbion ectosymbiont of Robbea hypermnestra]|nr:hypothetical protein [Candidatus Thiosymbion ectosymbiont of Robbea hypermnestra]